MENIFALGYSLLSDMMDQLALEASLHTSDRTQRVSTDPNWTVPLLPQTPG